MAASWHPSILQRIAEFLPRKERSSVFCKVSPYWQRALQPPAGGKKRKFDSIADETECAPAPAYADQYLELQGSRLQILPCRYHKCKGACIVREALRQRITALMPLIQQQQRLLREPQAINLEQHHQQLKDLCSIQTQEELDVCDSIQHAVDKLLPIQHGFLALLQAAKEAGDVQQIRLMGRQVNVVKADIEELNKLRKQITGKQNKAQRLTASFRAVHQIKVVDPTELVDVEPSAAGYERIMDFYRFTDAALYNFGRVYTGPNFFTDVKSNVAIVTIQSNMGCVLYNGYAVSGDRCCPGVSLRPGGPFQAVECQDGLGETYSRDYDAEFKLLTEFAVDFAVHKWPDWDGCGHCTLWSKKPLCISCHAVVYTQFPERFPHIKLAVIIGS